MATKSREDRALQLVEKLLALTDDEDLKERVRQIRDRIALPMAAVLRKVPGSSVVEKCEHIGVSRQSYYAWLYKRARPNPTQAVTLSQITGYDPAAIRGRGFTTKLATAALARATPPPPRRVKRNRDNLPA
jgi:hypothetical protein